ncbi:membrane assembly protein AsmA, partial [Acidovorax sp. SRB_14]|nr:membrane assembly protein AsmA [Acidovorax sp. SRB_14]
MLGTVAAVLVLLAVVLVVLSQWDWNRARPWINAKVSDTTGRHFAIEGDLTAQWQWPQPLEPGWQRWIPGVTVHAKQLVLGNRADLGRQGALDPADARAAPPTLAEAAPARGEGVPRGAAAAPPVPADTAADTAPPMATAAEASASLRLLPLLKRTLALGTVELSAPDVALARLADGRNNWTFTPRHAPPQSANPWNVTVDQLQVSEGQIAYADGLKDLALRAQVATIAEAPASPAGANAQAGAGGGPAPGAEAGAPPAQGAARYGVQFKVRGRFAKADLEGQGKAGDLLSLRNKVLDFPVQFSARAGDTRAEVEGTLTNPTALAGMDLRVLLAGATMADLYALTGLVLPNTPPYQTNGRLVGNLTPERATWDYQDFHGSLGKSDLHGHLTYTSGKPRPQLRGQVYSNTLRLADLGPVLGTPAGAPAKNTPPPPPGKVLPSKKFATERWNAMDLDIVFDGQKIIESDHLPLENLSVHAVLNNARLTLEPLRFGVARGKIDAQVVLDSRQDPLKAQVRATVDGLQLSALFPKVERMQKSLGRMDGAFALSGQGHSVGQMLGSSSGEARLYVRDGTLSKQLLDMAALNVGSIVFAKLFGETREVHLRCAVADLAVKQGMAQTRTAKLSTEEAIVEAVGTVDLAREHIDLRVKPESLQWKFFSLRTPLYVRGSFAKPDVGVEPGPLLLRAGAAVAAAV